MEDSKWTFGGRSNRMSIARLTIPLMGLLLTVGCTPGADVGRDSTAEAGATQQVTIDVRPDQPILLDMGGVVTVAGPIGAVKSPGQMRFTAVPAAQATPPDLTFDSVGTGVNVEVIGTELVEDLTLSFVEPPNEGQPTELAPALLHLTDEGDWNLEVASRDEEGRMVITTSDFSIRWPTWLNPAEIIGDMVDSATDALIGRTDADSCREDAPEWASLEKRTTLVHACAVSNPDDSGAVRAEAQLKSNRRFFTLVTTPPGADYVWAEEGSWLAKNVSSWLPTARGKDEYLLFPESRLTAGYRRPAVDVADQFTIALDHYTAGLSVALSFVGLFLPDDRAGWAAVLGMLLCADELPTHLGDGDRWWAYARCLFTDALPSLSDPGKAVATAEDLIGTVPVPDVRAAGSALDSAANAIRLFGQVMKVAGAATVVRDIFQQIPDAFSQMGADRTGDVRWTLRALKPPATPPPSSAPDVRDLVLTTRGLGPLLLGASIPEAERTGMVTWNPTHCPADIYGQDFGAMETADKYRPLSGPNPIGGDGFPAFLVGVDPETLLVNAIEVYDPAIATEEGTRVGDTPAALEDTYGSELNYGDDNDIAQVSYVRWLRRDGVDMIFDVLSGPEGQMDPPPALIWSIEVTTAYPTHNSHYQTDEGPGGC